MQKRGGRLRYGRGHAWTGRVKGGSAIGMMAKKKGGGKGR